VISGIPIVMAIAAITAFFVALTITSLCGEQDRERETEVSPREFWLLLSLLIIGIVTIPVLFMRM